MTHPIFVNIRSVRAGDVIALSYADVFLIEEIGEEVRTVAGTRKGVPSTWFAETTVAWQAMSLRAWDFKDPSVQNLSFHGLALETLRPEMPEFTTTIGPQIHLLLLRRDQTRESVRSM